MLFRSYLLSPVCNGIEKGLRFLLERLRGRRAAKPPRQPSANPLAKLFPRFFHKERSGKAVESLISGISIAGSLLLLILAVYGLIAMVVPQVVSSIRSIVEALPSYLQTAENWMIQFLNNNPEMARTVQQAIDSAVSWLQNWIKTDLLPRSEERRVGKECRL